MDYETGIREDGGSKMSHKPEQVKMTNMCMIMDPKTGKVLVQNRNKNDWDGVSFPGGHIERGEPIILSVFREIFEETGLKVKNLVPCGCKDWYDYEKEERYLVLFYKTSSYEGKLLPRSKEGENFWMSIEEIKQSVVAEDFIEMLEIFTGDSPYQEFFYEDHGEEEPRWVKKFY